MSRIAAWAASSVLLACVLAACGGASPNGVASKSPNGIVTAAIRAIDQATSAHLSGSLVSNGTPVSLDLDLVSGKGGRGEMSQGGLSFQIAVVGGEVYINGSEAFWDHFGGPAAEQQLNGKWLKAPASGSFASLAQLNNLHRLLGTLLSTHGALVKGGTTTIDGQSAVAVRDQTKDAILYVATTGPPYPLEIDKIGSQAGRISLSRFNESVSLTPPANALDISKLK